MMTLEQQLKHYITNLFKLPKDEKWECESIEEIADHILPDQYVRLGPLSNKILQTYTYYSDTLHESNIYPFILYYQKQLIAIGYIDETNDMDFLYLHNTVMPLLDQRHLLEKENHNNE
uniref:Uncharacterized protein n=3 Tax=Bacillales TaxID=1385 RepID=A0A1S6QLA5_MAMSC|nr:hypothetical protein [Mammaliicoccus sciuri]